MYIAHGKVMSNLWSAKHILVLFFALAGGLYLSAAQADTDRLELPEVSYQFCKELLGSQEISTGEGDPSILLTDEEDPEVIAAREKAEAERIEREAAEAIAKEEAAARKAHELAQERKKQELLKAVNELDDPKVLLFSMHGLLEQIESLSGEEAIKLLEVIPKNTDFELPKATKITHFRILLARGESIWTVYGSYMDINVSFQILDRLGPVSEETAIALGLLYKSIFIESKEAPKYITDTGLQIIIELAQTLIDEAVEKHLLLKNESSKADQ